MSYLKKQKKFWDKMASNEAFASQKVQQDFLFKIIGHYAKSASRILEYGSGFGNLMNEFYKRGYENVYGVDASPKMVKSAQSRHPHLSKNIAVCNPLDVPFSNNFFDVVILDSVLTCIIKYQDQLNLINSLNRVLKPKGILYIHDFLLNIHDTDISLYKKYQAKHKDEEFGVFMSSQGVTFHHHSPAWISNLTKNFDQLTLTEIKRPSLSGREITGFYYFGKKKD